MTTSRKAIGNFIIFFIAAIVAICALMLTSSVASAGVINVPADYPTIQQAINNVTLANRTIEVNATAYNAQGISETVDVTQSNIIIRSVNGQAVVSAGGASDHVFNITGQTNVTLEGFEIRDAHGTTRDVAGIYISNARECTISNDTVANISAVYDVYGIRLLWSDSNTFANTSVSNITGSSTNPAYGILLLYSSNNAFNSSTAVSNIAAKYALVSGIYLSSSDNNTFSGSTSVSNITTRFSPPLSGDPPGYGISLDDSSGNRFNSSTSVSTVKATNGNAYGISLKSSSNNNTFSSSTSVIDTVNSTSDTAYGIGLELNSDYNNFTGITITPTITGSEFYEFYSSLMCDENVVTNMTIGNPTTISFTYGNGVWLKRVNVSERPGDPENYRNISKYINASNVTPNSWLLVNFSYNDGDVYDAGITEGTLKVWKNNGTWNEEGWNGSRVLDTVNNVVGVNITRFCIFAPLVYIPTSVTIPTATGTGDVTITTSSGYFCSETNALPASPPDPPALTFTHGFFNITICGLNDTIAENVTINFTFPSAIPTDAEFWKYNASNGTWYRYDFGDNDGDNVISITITDNGPGDHNPALGTISDPNGIGWLPPAVAPVPVMTPLGLVALVGLLATLAVLTMRRKRR
jgi:hypothetical protein